MAFVNTVDSSEKNSYTARLIRVSDPLFDRSVSIIRKIATAIFSALVIPAAILFSLIADGIYYLFPNLKRLEPPCDPSITSMPSVEIHSKSEVVPALVDSQQIPSEKLTPKDPSQIEPSENLPSEKTQLKEPVENQSTSLLDSPKTPTEKPTLIEQPEQRSTSKGFATIGKVALAAAGVGLLVAGTYALYSYCSLPQQALPEIKQVIQPIMNQVLDSGNELVPIVKPSHLIPTTLGGQSLTTLKHPLIKVIGNRIQSIWNSPAIEELSPKRGRDSPTANEQQVPCCKLQDSSANSAVNGRDCARAAVQWMVGNSAISSTNPSQTLLLPPPIPQVDVSCAPTPPVTAKLPTVPSVVNVSSAPTTPWPPAANPFESVPPVNAKLPTVPSAVNVSSAPTTPWPPGANPFESVPPVNAKLPTAPSTVNVSSAPTTPWPPAANPFESIPPVNAKLPTAPSAANVSSAPTTPWSPDPISVSPFVMLGWALGIITSIGGLIGLTMRREMSQVPAWPVAASDPLPPPQNVNIVPVQDGGIPDDVLASLREFYDENQLEAPFLPLQEVQAPMPVRAQSPPLMGLRDSYRGHVVVGMPLALQEVPISILPRVQSPRLEPSLASLALFGVQSPRLQSPPGDWDLIDLPNISDGWDPMQVTDLIVAPSSIAPIVRAVKPGYESKGLKYVFSLAAVRDSLGEQTGRILEELRSYIHSNQNEPNFLGSDFHQCSSSILLAIAALNQSENEKLIRDAYKIFISESRNALMLAKKLPKVPHELMMGINFLKLIHHLKYTSVSMYPFFVDFISKALASSKYRYNIPDLDLHNVADAIHNANQSLKRKYLSIDYLQEYFAMQLKKLEGTIGLFFDPSADSNTPWVHSYQEFVRNGQRKVITVLRHGTPTRDPGVAGAILRESMNVVNRLPFSKISRNSLRDLVVVTPEYRANLEANPHAQFLYVNHQEYTDDNDRPLHGEGSRSLALQALQRQHKNFHFAAFPMDGRIWKKLKSFSIDELKQILFDSLINQDNGFALPDQLSVNENHVKLLLNKIHQFYFMNEEIEGLDQKTAFIMIFYSYLKNYLKAELNIDFIANPCKDYKDRGNASSLTDMIINMMLLRQEKDPKRLEELFFTALGPFIIKNEAIIDERLEMALVVIEQIAKLSTDQKEAIREAFPRMTGLEIISQTVPKDVPECLLKPNGPGFRIVNDVEMAAT